MKTHIRQQNGISIFEPCGKIVGPSVSKLRQALLREIEASASPRILINFKRVRMIDCSGLGTLIEAHTATTFCPECGVAFQIVVIAEVLGDQNVRALRFQPNAKHLPDEADGEHTDALDRHPPQIEQKVEQKVEQRIEQQTDAIEHTYPENRNNDTPDEVIETQVPKEVEHDTENREHSQVEHKTIEHPPVEQDTVEHSQIEWQTDDELAIAFIETHLIAEVEHFLPTPEIYHRYQTFAEKRNRTPLKDQKLYKHIRDRFSVEKTRRRSNGKLQYGFIGIRCLKRNNETPDDRRS